VDVDMAHAVVARFFLSFAWITMGFVSGTVDMGRR